ncbi:MAG TPA: hypothetical protein VIL00_07150 [Pseudonocardiaceae bacterium]
MLLDGATIDGDLVARDVVADRIRLVGARLHGDLDLTDGRLDTPDDDALDLDRATINGDLLARTLTVSGRIYLGSARLHGGLYLSGARLTNENSEVLNLDGALIEGSVFAREAVTTGEARLPGARIGGQLVLDDAQLTNPDGDALDLDHAAIGGGLFARNLTVSGQVRLPSARIDGQFVLTSAQLTSPGATALDLDRATIDDNLFAWNTTITGQVQLSGARIGGHLNLSGTKLTNKKGEALILDGATIGGDLLLNEGFTALGQVRLHGVHIGGRLDLSEARLTNPHSTALGLDNATVGGDLLADRGFATNGEVCLYRARIGGRLDLVNAWLSNPGRTALNLTETQAAHLVLFPHPKSRGVINLRDARVGRFVDDPRRWPEACRIDLDGFRYERLSRLPGSTSPACSIEKRLAWMRDYTLTTQLPGTAPKSRAEFLPDPYEQLAAALRRDGQERQARLVSRERERLRHRTLGPLGRLWGAIQRWTVGYGYQPARVLVWVLGVLTAGTLYFAGVGPLPSVRPDEQLAWDPFLYTLDLVVPLLDLGHEKAWDPVGWHQGIAVLFLLVGWMLVVSVAAGIGRVLRRP